MNAEQIYDTLNTDEWSYETPSWLRATPADKLQLVQAWMDRYDGDVDDRHHFHALWSFADSVASLLDATLLAASSGVEILRWMLQTGGAWTSRIHAAVAYREYMTPPPNPFAIRVRPWNEYASDILTTLGIRNRV